MLLSETKLILITRKLLQGSVVLDALVGEIEGAAGDALVEVQNVVGGGLEVG